jgi:hypothetical protein
MDRDTHLARPGLRVGQLGDPHDQHVYDPLEESPPRRTWR